MARYRSVARTSLSYGEMLDRMAIALGLRSRPRTPVPLITPWLSSLWIGLVTPVDAGVARRSSRGSPFPRWSTMPPARLFDVEPIDFDAALRRAIAEEASAPVMA